MPHIWSLCVAPVSPVRSRDRFARTYSVRVVRRDEADESDTEITRDIKRRKYINNKKCIQNTMVSDGTQSRARAPPGRGARSTVCVCGRVGAAKPYHCSDPTIETDDATRRDQHTTNSRAGPPHSLPSPRHPPTYQLPILHTTLVI